MGNEGWLGGVCGFCYNCGKPLVQNEMTVVVPVDERGEKMTGVVLCGECMCSMLDFMVENGHGWKWE